MIYATVQDMIDRFGELEMIQLTDTVNIPQSTVDVARVEVKLGDASAFVDGYIGQVYRMPLRGCAKPVTTPGGAIEYTPPPVLTRIACDVARYYLHDDLAPEHEVYRRYQACIKELDAIVAGKSMLACPWGGSPGDLVSNDAQTGREVGFEFGRRFIDEDVSGSYA